MVTIVLKPIYVDSAMVYLFKRRMKHFMWYKEIVMRWCSMVGAQVINLQLGPTPCHDGLVDKAPASCTVFDYESSQTKTEQHLKSQVLFLALGIKTKREELGIWVEYVLCSSCNGYQPGPGHTACDLCSCGE